MIYNVNYNLNPLMNQMRPMPPTMFSSMPYMAPFY